MYLEVVSRPHGWDIPSCLLLHPLCLQQFLAHSRCSVNTR